MNAASRTQPDVELAEDPRVASARKGDAQAFTELVSEVEEVLFVACYRVLRHRQAAEDATQDALLNAWRKIETAPPHAFRPWMFRLALNCAINQLRRAARRPEAPLDMIVEPVANQPTPEMVVIEWELHALISTCMERLPPKQREVLWLRHENDLDYVEIAGRTRTSVGTVKSRISRGRQRLSALLVTSSFAPNQRAEVVRHAA